MNILLSKQFPCNVVPITTDLTLLPALILHLYCITCVGRDNAVAIATHYGLDGRGSNPGGDEIFRICTDRPWDPPSVYNGYGVIPGGRAAEVWR